MLRWLVCAVFSLLAASEPVSWSLVTWNVLADPAHAGQRVPGIMAELERLKPDLIALQEVAPWMLVDLQRQPFFRDYRLTVIGNRVSAPGGVFLAARTAVRDPRIVVIPSRQDRCALVADIEVTGGIIQVATVHLESFLEDGEIRAQQLRAVAAALAGADEAMILGDCNFGNGEQPETAAIPQGFTDLWSQLKGDVPGFTWDRALNPSANAGSFAGEASRRLDRIFLKSKRWQPAEMELVGVRPVAVGGDLHPSDHFGVYLRLIANAP